MMELTIGAQVTLAVAVAALLGYPLFMRYLDNKMQPLRLRMADLGCELLSAEGANDRAKDVVESMLSDAYRWQAMLVFVLALPVYFVRRGSKHGRRQKIVFADGKHEKKFHEFVAMYFVSITAANPLCSLVFLIELLFVGLLLLCFGSIFKIGDILFDATVYAEASERSQPEAC